jgi:hypothetical protein
LSRCTAIKPNGERCKGGAIQGSEWCWNHNPAHAGEHRRHGSRGGKRGGRGRPASELQEVKSLLATLTARVLREEGTEPLETGPAVVANQLINTRLRAIDLERKLKETEQLETRLEALEEALEQRKDGCREWGT